LNYNLCRSCKPQIQTKRKSGESVPGELSQRPARNPGKSNNKVLKGSGKEELGRKGKKSWGASRAI